MIFDTEGKYAIITGGATGIGLSYAVELFKNGIQGIVIADVNLKKGNEAVNELNKEFGNKAVFIATDVTKSNELEAAFKFAKSTFGRIDIVINNAGILNDTQWELEIAINCNAVVKGSLLAIKYMGKNNGGNGGVVANTASVAGLQKVAGCPIYTGTKHFIVGLSTSFGSQYYYDLTGIKFVTICPGVTKTSLLSEVISLEGFPDLEKVLSETLNDLPVQETDNVAQGMITLIKHGGNGSVWVSEGGQPVYEVDIPDRMTLRKK